MHAIISGFLAGAAAGVIMGVISHILFKLHVFRSSLIVIDGSFLFRTTGRHAGPGPVAAAGLIIHLLTSGVFGAVYFAATAILGMGPAQAADSLMLTSLYIAVLWLSMLFVALPVAGEELFGRRSGRYAWLEQLALHVIFLIAYIMFVKILI